MYAFENLCLDIYKIKRTRFFAEFPLSVTSFKISIQPLHYCTYIYSRTSIIWPFIIWISGLTKMKSCAPNGSTYNTWSSMSDITEFYQ